jgi:hypothetical protein
MKKITIPKLDMHIADSCNLRCEQCDHFSNYIFTKVFDYDTIKSWCDPWKDKLLPLQFNILGGEPLMNKDVVRILYLMRETWIDSEIILWSNGLLLKNFPDLPKALKENNIRLEITNHSTSNSEAYDRKFSEAIEILKEWFIEYQPDITIHDSKGNHVRFGTEEGKFFVYNHKIDVGPEGTSWEKFYHGYGKNIRPYNDGNPQASWDNCTSKCPQLYEGRIHKCAPLTFLPLMDKKFKLSEEWKPYLEYKGVSPDCSEEELVRFLNIGAEHFCGMCPIQRPKFVSTHNPFKVEDKSIL